MNFLGLGPGELMLILVLALIVFGPQRMPEIGAQVGKAIREFRRATDDVTREINRELSLENTNAQRRKPVVSPTEPVQIDSEQGADDAPAAPAPVIYDERTVVPTEQQAPEPAPVVAEDAAAAPAAEPAWPPSADVTWPPAAGTAVEEEVDSLKQKAGQSGEATPASDDASLTSRNSPHPSGEDLPAPEGASATPEIEEVRPETDTLPPQPR